VPSGHIHRDFGIGGDSSRRPGPARTMIGSPNRLFLRVRNMDNSNTSAGDRVVAVVHRLISSRSITRRVSAEDTLAEAGLTSLDSIRLVLLVEDDFNIEIPVSELTLANFRTISTISRLVTKLLTST
jgi:acyl carrier protein